MVRLLGICSLVVLAMTGVMAEQLPSTPLRATPRLPPSVASRGATAVLLEVQTLRLENAQLRAALIDRDRQLANVRYELGRKVLELTADRDQCVLNVRADILMPTLRDLFKVTDPETPFDWTTQKFLVKTKETVK